MRRLFAIFIICTAILFSILLCNADEHVSIQKDLPFAMKYEPEYTGKQLDIFKAETQVALAEQQLNINTLSFIYYMGYTNNHSFDGKSLDRSMECSKGLVPDAPIYKSELYKNYYAIRTGKLLKQYKTTHIFDFDTFTKNARTEFDNYLKKAVADEAARKELVILMQEKLTDKLPELEPSKRKVVLDEIYSLRLPANRALCNDYLYQVFEYGVRAEALSQMMELNKEMLIKLSHDIAINITAKKSGKLLLQYKNSQGNMEALQVLNAAKDGQSYNGLTVLGELYGKKDGRLVFVDVSGSEYMIGLDEAKEAIDLDENGYLQLKLEPLLEQNQADAEYSNRLKAVEDIETKLAEKQMKNLETSYSSKLLEAQEIVKELNRYSMYLELKNKGISNYFTRSFEADKKAWKAAIDIKLNRFGSGGMADFAAYIKEFVLTSRNKPRESERGRILIARFRNSIIQYRKPDDGSVWITDMLYNIKYMK